MAKAKKKTINKKKKVSKRKPLVKLKTSKPKLGEPKMALIDELKTQISGALDQAYNQGISDGKSGQAASDAAPVQAIEKELHDALDKAAGELSSLESSASQPAQPAAPAQPSAPASDAPATPAAPTASVNTPAAPDSTSQPDPSVAQSDSGTSPGSAGQPATPAGA